MKNNNINMKFEEVNGRMENMNECSTLDNGNLVAWRINEVHDSMENLNECSTLLRSD